MLAQYAFEDAAGWLFARATWPSADLGNLGAAARGRARSNLTRGSAIELREARRRWSADQGAVEKRDGRPRPRAWLDASDRRSLSRAAYASPATRRYVKGIDGDEVAGAALARQHQRTRPRSCSGDSGRPSPTTTRAPSGRWTWTTSRWCPSESCRATCGRKATSRASRATGGHGGCPGLPTSSTSSVGPSWPRGRARGRAHDCTTTGEDLVVRTRRMAHRGPRPPRRRGRRPRLDRRWGRRGVIGRDNGDAHQHRASRAGASARTRPVRLVLWSSGARRRVAATSQPPGAVSAGEGRSASGRTCARSTSAQRGRAHAPGAPSRCAAGSPSVLGRAPSRTRGARGRVQPGGHRRRDVAAEHRQCGPRRDSAGAEDRGRSPAPEDLTEARLGRGAVDRRASAAAKSRPPRRGRRRDLGGARGPRSSGDGAVVERAPGGHRRALPRRVVATASFGRVDTYRQREPGCPGRTSFGIRGATPGRRPGRSHQSGCGEYSDSRGGQDGVGIAASAARSSAPRRSSSSPPPPLRPST